MKSFVLSFLLSTFFITSHSLAKNPQDVFKRFIGTYKNYSGDPSCPKYLEAIVVQEEKGITLWFLGKNDDSSKGEIFSNFIFFDKPREEEKNIICDVVVNDGDGFNTALGVDKKCFDITQSLIKPIVIYQVLQRSNKGDTTVWLYKRKNWEEKPDFECSFEN